MASRRLNLDVGLSTLDPFPLPSSPTSTSSSQPSSPTGTNYNPSSIAPLDIGRNRFSLLNLQYSNPYAASQEYGGGNGYDNLPKDAVSPYESEEPWGPYNVSSPLSIQQQLQQQPPQTQPFQRTSSVSASSISASVAGVGYNRPESLFSSSSGGRDSFASPSPRFSGMGITTAGSVGGPSCALQSGRRGDSESLRTRNGMGDKSPSWPLSPVSGVASNPFGFRVRGRDSDLLTRSSASVTTTALARAISEHEPYSVVDNLLFNVQDEVGKSGEMAQQFVDAGIVQNLDSLLVARGVEGLGLEIVIQTIGYLAQESSTCMVITKSRLLSGLLCHVTTPSKPVLETLSLWVLARLTCTLEISQTLQKTFSGTIDSSPLIPTLLAHGFSTSASATQAAYFLGNTVYNDSTAETLMNSRGFTDQIIKSLKNTLDSQTSPTEMEEEVSSYLYAIARTSRSIKIAKTWHSTGAIELIVRYLNGSDSPKVLHWAARAVGCLMRPNSSDMAKALLTAGAARALARVPRVVGLEVEPLGSLAFAVQRFSAAEWGSGTRKALVAAGVVDSLLSAFRAVASLPVPETQAEIAYGVSSLCDVGGGDLRKEIIRTGGIDMLKRVGDNSPNKEVQKACGLAIQTITGNILTRNTASAKTALNHNWSGGADIYRPWPCPIVIQPCAMDGVASD